MYQQRCCSSWGNLHSLYSGCNLRNLYAFSHEQAYFTCGLWNACLDTSSGCMNIWMFLHVDDLKVNYVAHLISNTVSNEASHFPLISHLRISLNIRRFELSSDGKLLHSLVLLKNDEMEFKILIFNAFRKILSGILL